MTTQQPWLISFEFYTHFTFRDVKVKPSREGPAKTVLVIDTPPWKYLAETKTKLNAIHQGEWIVEGGRNYQCADEIVAVFWAVQLPIGALSEDEMDLLR